MPVAGGDESPGIELDPTTPVGLVRLLITDVDAENLLFTDAEITRMVALEGGNVKLAAATLLGVIATSEVLLSKKFSTHDLSVDGPAVAAALMKQADRLRDQGKTDPIDEDDGEPIVVAPLWRFPSPSPYGDLLL